MGARCVYIAIPKFGTYPKEWISAIRRLQIEDGVIIRGVDACLREDPQTALLRLRMDFESTWQLSTLVIWAYNEGVQLIDPRTLEKPQRDFFYASYLTQFKVIIRDFVKPDAALFALARYQKTHVQVQPRAKSPPPENLAMGTVNTKRADIEWKVPRVRVADRTRNERPGNGTRTMSGTIGDRDAFWSAGTIDD